MFRIETSSRLAIKINIFYSHRDIEMNHESIFLTMDLWHNNLTKNDFYPNLA